MPSSPEFIYWDSCVFLAYIQNEPDRISILEGVLTDVRRSDGRKKIVTSAFSVSEVAFLAEERDSWTLLPDAEDRIDSLWRDHSVVELIEFHEEIARMARHLVRYTFAQKWKSLRSADAIQLASAQWIRAKELHTYDTQFPRYGPLLGCVIGEPSNVQLPLM